MLASMYIFLEIEHVLFSTLGYKLVSRLEIVPSLLSCKKGLTLMNNRFDLIKSINEFTNREILLKKIIFYSHHKQFLKI